MKKQTTPAPTYLVAGKTQQLPKSKFVRWLQRWFGGLAVAFTVTTVLASVPVANKPMIGSGTVGANNIVTARCIAKQQIVNLTVTVNGAVNTSYEANWTDLNTLAQGSGSTFTASVGDMVGVTVGWAQPLPKGSSVKIALA